MLQGNGVETTYSYNPYTTRISSIYTHKGSTILQNKSYIYSDAGDITRIDDTDGVTYDYTYDDLHRLETETNDGGYGYMTVYYDAIGNITQKTVGSNTLTYSYNDNNHKHAVSAINGYNFVYDNNGNMTDGYDFTDPSTPKRRQITYNINNGPLTIDYNSGQVVATIRYDGTGARAKKTVGSVVTYYIGDHYEIIGGTATRYIFAGNLRVAQVKGSTITYFHKDHLGSSAVMTNSSGNQIESTNYMPFGGMRAHSGTTTSNYKFTDQELDAENGLYNYNARLYDPIIGRFISADPIVPEPYNPQSLNRYTYCLNNPLIYTDPSGHNVWSWITEEWRKVLEFLGGRSLETEKTEKTEKTEYTLEEIHDYAKQSSQKNSTCTYRALEEVIAAGESKGIPTDKAYRTNTFGEVAKTKTDALKHYVGEKNVVITAEELANLKGHPMLYVPTRFDAKGNPIEYTSAFGRYQLTASGKGYGLTDWSPAGQDKWVGKQLIDMGAVAAAQGGNFAGAMALISAPDAWASMPGGTQQKITFEQAEKVYINALATLPECK
jgi:RHS repeat-associated protein